MKVAPRFTERQNGAGTRRVMEIVRNTDSCALNDERWRLASGIAPFDEVPNTVRYNNGNLQWGH